MIVPAISFLGAVGIWLLAIKAAADWRGMKLFTVAVGASWLSLLLVSLYVRSDAPTSAPIYLYPPAVLCVMVSVGLVMSLVPITVLVAIRSAKSAAANKARSVS